MRNTKTRIEDLIEGDVVKVSIPVRIVKIGDTEASLGSMNDGSTLKTIGACVHEGAFKNSTAAMICSGSDKVEVIASGRPSLIRRICDSVVNVFTIKKRS